MNCITKGLRNMEQFLSLPIVVQTLILSAMTCGLTMLGASMVFFFKNVNKTVINILLSISAGIMLASAFFSLLLPSIEQSEQVFGNKFLLPTLGFFGGGVFVILVDIFLDKVTKNNEKLNFSGKKRQFLLVSAITFHNIPEGMCVGVAVACASLGTGSAGMNALLLALGIGIQNFPEGASVALPMRSEGASRLKAFMWGSLSGVVEPIFAILACLTAGFSSVIMPLLLAVSSGAMISVACTELIAESARDNKNLTTLFVILGFCIMMILDLAF